jgi:hypothetical protein
VREIFVSRECLRFDEHRQPTALEFLVKLEIGGDDDLETFPKRQQ